MRYTVAKISGCFDCVGVSLSCSDMQLVNMV